jgi:hypothetical protein
VDDESQEDRAIGPALHRHRGLDAIEGERTYERLVASPIDRSPIVDALPTWGPSVEGSQRQMSASLIEEHQALRLDGLHLLHEGCALLLSLLGVVFGGSERLFLRVKPRGPSSCSPSPAEAPATTAPVPIRPTHPTCLLPPISSRAAHQRTVWWSNWDVVTPVMVA